MSEAAPRLIIVHAAAPQGDSEIIAGSYVDNDGEHLRSTLDTGTIRLLAAAAERYDQLINDTPDRFSPQVYVSPPSGEDDDARSLFHKLAIRELMDGQTTDASVPARDIIDLPEASLAKARRSPVDHVAHVVDELYGDRRNVPLMIVVGMTAVSRMFNDYNKAKLCVEAILGVDSDGKATEFHQKSADKSVDNPLNVA